MRVKAVLLCLRYPGIKVMIVRKTYPELRENHILPLCELLGCYREREEERFEEIIKVPARYWHDLQHALRLSKLA